MRAAVAKKENVERLRGEPLTWKRFLKGLERGKYVYMMLLPVMAWYIIFCYVPMYGIIIAFRDYIPGQSFSSGEWVGFKYFISFFESPFFLRTIKNTVLLNLWDLAFGFPAPIILALVLNEIRAAWFKKLVQTITYLPHFVALVVIIAIVKDVLASDGLFNEINKWFQITFSGLEPSAYKPIMYLDKSEYFRPIYVFSGIWQGIGWGSIIYLSALSGIDTQLYEAANMDGAGRFRKIWNITLPGIAPTVVILLIFAVGGIFSSGFEKIILLYKPLTYEVSDVVATYVYRKGLEEAQFSFSTAVGLFNTVINFILLITVNKISRKLTETSLW